MIKGHYVQEVRGVGCPQFCVLTKFDASLYHDAMYERYRVTMPEHIRRSVVKRRAEYLAGRVSASMALRQFGYENFQVRSGCHREPIWPSGLIGSISHNADMAAAVVCSRTAVPGVGIDIETIIADAGTRDAVALSAITETESIYLHSMTPDICFEFLLTLVFSAKESFFKAAFGRVGYYFDFFCIRVEDLDYTAGKITFVLDKTLHYTLKKGDTISSYFNQVSGSSIFTSVALDR